MAHDTITVTIDGFQKVAEAWMKDYANATDAQVRKATDQTAVEVRRRTAEASPVRTGVYKKGWRSKVTSNARMQYTRTVYNQLKPHLTHLLENGHGMQKGIFAAGIYAKARHHIVTDASTEIIFRDKLRKLIQKEG